MTPVPVVAPSPPCCARPVYLCRGGSSAAASGSVTLARSVEDGGAWMLGAGAQRSPPTSVDVAGGVTRHGGAGRRLEASRVGDGLAAGAVAAPVRQRVDGSVISIVHHSSRPPQGYAGQPLHACVQASLITSGHVSLFTFRFGFLLEQTTAAHERAWSPTKPGASTRAPTTSRVAQKTSIETKYHLRLRAHIKTQLRQAREQPHKTKTGDTKTQMDTTAHKRKKCPCPADAVRFTRALLHLACRPNRCSGEQNPCLPAAAR